MTLTRLSTPAEANGRRTTTERRRSPIAPPRPRPLHCSAVTREWLDFVAGQLAQAAWAERVADTATRTSDFSCRLLAMCLFHEYMAAACLTSYSASPGDPCRRAATYVDKIHLP